MPFMAFPQNHIVPLPSREHAKRRATFTFGKHSVLGKQFRILDFDKTSLENGNDLGLVFCLGFLRLDAVQLH